MQGRVHGIAPGASYGDGQSPMSVEDAVGDAFLQLVAEAHDQGQVQVNDSLKHEMMQAFAHDVRRRKEEPPGSYEDFVDLAASAAVCVLVYGQIRPKDRKDLLPLTVYRRMVYLVRREPPRIRSNSDPRRRSAGEETHLRNGGHELETLERQQLLGEAYDTGFSAGFEAGTQTEAAKRRTDPEEIDEAFADGFAAGQRRLMDSEIAFAFARGQEAEQHRLRGGLAQVEGQGDQVRDTLEGIPGTTTESPGQLRHPRPPSASTTDAAAPDPPQHACRGSDFSHTNPPAAFSEATHTSHIFLNSSPADYRPILPRMGAPESASEGVILPNHFSGLPNMTPADEASRNGLATCAFCGIKVSHFSILRHKRRHHRAELAAVGKTPRKCPCWWPDCGQLRDNSVPSQLTTHLQRKHNFSPPGDSMALSENVKYLKRMPVGLQISIIAEAAQQLNAVKQRIRDLEGRLRRRRPSYVSRHRLPDVCYLHEFRPRVLSTLLQDHKRLPSIIQELRQLTRARGMRSQVRRDEGTWWEVADDLEAGLYPSSKLARAVAALPPPDSEPTVPLHIRTFFEAPNMNDPSWIPQYSVPLQAGWDVTGPDGSPVWTRADTGAFGNTSGATASEVKNEPEDGEENGGGQDLVAGISRRVLHDRPQWDWGNQQQWGWGWVGRC